MKKTTHKLLLAILAKRVILFLSFTIFWEMVLGQVVQQETPSIQKKENIKNGWIKMSLCDKQLTFWNGSTYYIDFTRVPENDSIYFIPLHLTYFDDGVYLVTDKSSYDKYKDSTFSNDLSSNNKFVLKGDMSGKYYVNCNTPCVNNEMFVFVKIEDSSKYFYNKVIALKYYGDYGDVEQHLGFFLDSLKKNKGLILNQYKGYSFENAFVSFSTNESDKIKNLSFKNCFVNFSLNGKIILRNNEISDTIISKIDSIVFENCVLGYFKAYRHIIEKLSFRNMSNNDVFIRIYNCEIKDIGSQQLLTFNGIELNKVTEYRIGSEGYSPLWSEIDISNSTIKSQENHNISIESRKINISTSQFFNNIDLYCESIYCNNSRFYSRLFLLDKNLYKISLRDPNLNFSKCSFDSSVVSGLGYYRDDNHSFNDSILNTNIFYDNYFKEGISCDFPNSPKYYGLSLYNISKVYFNYIVGQKTFNNKCLWYFPKLSLLNFPVPYEQNEETVTEINNKYSEWLDYIENYPTTNSDLKNEAKERLKYNREIMRFGEYYYKGGFYYFAFAWQTILYYTVNLGYKGLNNWLWCSTLFIFGISILYILKYRKSIRHYIAQEGQIAENFREKAKEENLVKFEKGNRLNYIFSLSKDFIRALWFSTFIYLNPKLPIKYLTLKGGFFRLVIFNWVIGFMMFILFIVYIASKFEFVRYII